MDGRTRRYVAGRFRDHYRRVSLNPPEAALEREWGFIPWHRGQGTTMIRHRSLPDLGGLDSFLQDQQPRHVYYSAGRYADPAAGVMGAKGWKGADLIFDLDADHLPGVSPDDSYRSMLERCKEELYNLLDFLEHDFGFDSPDVVFSGGRGYHVHIREEDVRTLPREARREIADYIQGEAVELRGIVDRELVAGVGRETPAEVRRLNIARGWGARVHRTMMEYVNELQELPRTDAVDKLQQFEGIGEHRAEAILNTIDSASRELAKGNIDVHPAFPTFIDAIIDQTVRAHGAAIDEPVTTDVNRLIRLPGSIHGGSGLVTRRIAPNTLDMFEPLEHAIPETFRGQSVAIKCEDSTTVELGGTRQTLHGGSVRVPEFIGIHLMVTEQALKVAESSA